MSSEKLKTCALTIAGSDSCGGAGIQADLKTFAAYGVYGASVISSVTAQNTLGVFAANPVPDELLADQLDAVLDDLPVRAIKTGMLPGAGGIEYIATRLAGCTPQIPLVVDPVLIATSGARLSDDAALAALKKHLFPLASVVTPNLAEAAALTGLEVVNQKNMEAAGVILLELGCSAVLMKGGHLISEEITDLLITSKGVRSFSHQARMGIYHGTGCTLSAAIAAGLAQGVELEKAVASAVEFVQVCIRDSTRPRKGKAHLLGFPRSG